MAVALMVTQLPAMAFAEHGGREVGSLLSCDRPVSPPRCTSVGDDLRHHVAFDVSLTDDLASSLRGTMTEDYGSTRLTMIEDETITPWTDVIASSGDYGDNGAAAWVYCPPDAPQGINPSGDRWCRHQELFFNLNPRFSLFYDDAASRDHVACHELGHTLGLRHWGNPPHSQGPAAETCMNSNTPNGPTRLHRFDLDHLDAYPYRVPRLSPGVRIVRSPVDQATAAVPSSGSMMGTSEVEVPTSLAELVEDADVVVRGRVVSVEPGRVFGPAHRALHYAAITVTVDQIIAGRPAAPGATALTLEVPLFDGLHGLAALRGRTLGSERLLFLRNKGESARAAGLPFAHRLGERAFYRLVTFGSEIGNRAGMAVVSPDETGLLDPFDGTSFEEAVAVIGAVAEK